MRIGLRRALSPPLLCTAVLLALSLSAIAQGLPPANEGYAVLSATFTGPVLASTALAPPYRAVAEGPYILIVDESNPDSLRVVGELALPQSVLGMTLWGSYLFVADGAGGIAIVNVSNPLAPSFVGRYKTHLAVAVAVSSDGSHAYVFTGGVSIEVINVENLAKPKRVHVISHTKALFTDGVVSGDTLVAAAGPRGLEVFNIKHPGLPYKIQRTKKLLAANKLSLSGRLLAVADADAGLVMVDYSTWTAPRVLGTLATTGQALDCGFLGTDPTKVVVAEGSSGFLLADVSDPSAPVALAQSAVPVPVTAISAEGLYTYASCGPAGLWRLGFTDPANPTSTLALPGGNGWGVVTTVGTYMYATVENQLEVWDFSDTAHPAFVRSVTMPAEAVDLTVDSSLLLASCQTGGLVIYDISSPASPVSLSVFPAGLGSVSQSATSGNLLAVSDSSSGVLLVDITNPAAPTQVGAWISPKKSKKKKIKDYVSGANFSSPNVLWVADSVEGIVSLDVTTPSAPVELGALGASSLSKLYVGGNSELFALQSYLGVGVISTADPAKPTLLSTLSTTNTLNFVYDGTIAMVCDGTQGFKEFDLSDVKLPTQVTLFGAPASAYGAGVLPDGTRIVTSREGGLFALQTTSCAGQSLLLPCDNQSLNGFYTGLFSWTPITDATYRLQISLSPDFPNNQAKTLEIPAAGIGAQAKSFVAPSTTDWHWILKHGLGQVPLYWRVLYKEGKTKTQSETRTFTVE